MPSLSRLFPALLRLLPAALAVVLSACGTREDKTPATLLPPDLALRAGDIVFRQGESPASRAVLIADRIGEYSHIGIVADSGGQPYVVHAVPDEPDFPGDTDRIKMESPEEFFSTRRAAIGQVMRWPDSIAAAQAAKTALRLYRKGLPFDHEYNDADSTSMYCTELVRYAFRSAGVSLEGTPARRIPLPGFKYPCFLPSSVARAEGLQLLSAF